MKKYSILICGCFSFFGAFAQEINQEKLIRLRDSLDNMLMVNPTSSAILVRKGDIELYSFSSLMSSNTFNDREGNPTFQPVKYSLFNSTFQLNAGISKSKRINIGLDLNYRAYHIDPDKNSSVLRVFTSNEQTTSALNYAGLRVRVQPFKRVKNFTWQTYYWLPVAAKNIRTPLGSSKANWGNTFFYYKYIFPKVGLFLQANITLALPSGAEPDGIKAPTEFYVPVTAAFSVVATRKDILVGGFSYTWMNDDIRNAGEGADHDFAQFLAGYQRVVSKRFFVNLNYTGTVMARNYGEWTSFNLGIRYVL